MDIIDSKNFDSKFLKILKNKKGRNVAKGRFDIENIEMSKKSDFIVAFLLSLKFIKGITYKILFWEKDDVLTELFKFNFSNKKSEISVSYRSGKLPGVLFVNDREVDELFLRLILENHFNYEMAKNPALNLRVQICINQEEFLTLLDIYDDRGFDIYYLSCR